MAIPFHGEANVVAFSHPGLTAGTNILLAAPSTQVSWVTNVIVQISAAGASGEEAIFQSTGGTELFRVSEAAEGTQTLSFADFGWPLPHGEGLQVVLEGSVTASITGTVKYAD